MTALDKYVRLESDALWRAAPDAQRRDVGLSFGDATLVIADAAGRPLSHWSLPAVIRVNPDETPAIYAPDEDHSELLEIAEPTMVEAIEEVRKALARQRPHPGKLRHWLTGGLIAITLLLAIFWLPGALTRQTLAVVPTPKRVAFGQAMLDHLQPQIGTACRSPTAVAASERLMQRLFGAQTGASLRVVPDMAQGAAALPGGIIVISHQVLQRADDPAVAAGYILASRAALSGDGALGAVLADAGLPTTFRLLTTGDIQDSVLRDAAFAALDAGAAQADPKRLRDLLATAQIPQGPYLAAVDAQTGTMPDIGSDPMVGRAVPVILGDNDWVALQNICND